MTSILDTLEKRGLIRRIPHPDDRRKLHVELTPEAEAILNELLPSLHARERDVICGALSSSEQRQLLRLIGKVQRAATEASSMPPVRGAVRNRPRRPAAQAAARSLQPRSPVAAVPAIQAPTHHRARTRKGDDR
jgi:hypothetical protein